MVDHSDDIDEHDPTVHHEERDISISGVMKIIIASTVFTVVLFIALWFIFDLFRDQERVKDLAQVSEVEGSADRQYPPAPRLQPFPEPASKADPSKLKFVGLGANVSNQPVNNPTRSTPVTDMVEMNREQRADIESYAWIDRRQGLVRIPIADAKRILVARGLPVRTEPATAAAGQAQPGTTTNTGLQPQVENARTIGTRQGTAPPVSPRPAPQAGAQQ
jgi:hypothetical protein